MNEGFIYLFTRLTLLFCALAVWCIVDWLANN